MGLQLLCHLVEHAGVTELERRDAVLQLLLMLFCLICIPPEHGQCGPSLLVLSHLFLNHGQGSPAFVCLRICLGVLRLCGRLLLFQRLHHLLFPSLFRGLPPRLRLCFRSRAARSIESIAAAANDTVGRRLRTQGRPQGPQGRHHRGAGLRVQGPRLVLHEVHPDGFRGDAAAGSEELLVRIPLPAGTPRGGGLTHAFFGLASAAPLSRSQARLVIVCTESILSRYSSP
mmetsp:Transcript_1382/g.5588  ORF Transcript_1382/g.5588 Transcript_1382/m.5588 type:complete len:229 (-) Transcript_1382:29-715(-)